MSATSKAASGGTVHDKEGVEINLGDTVSTKFRGGRHSGKVVDIVHTAQEKEVKGVSVSVKHPPKVLFFDQNDNLVQHNPGTLVHGEGPEGGSQKKE